MTKIDRRLNRHRRRSESRFVRNQAFTPASLEELESRQLLATVNWVNPSDGFWDVAANWSTGTVPGSADDAVIDVAGASPTVTIRSSQSVKSLTSKDALVQSAGTLALAADSEIDGSLNLGSSINSSGTLALKGLTTWTSGTISGSGKVVNTGTMTINPSANSAPDLAGVLDDAGTIAQIGTNKFLIGNGALNVKPGAVYDFQSDGSFGFPSGGAFIMTVNVQGTLRKSSGSGSTSVPGGLNLQGGTIDVRSGTLGWGGTGTSNGGTITIATGATLDMRPTGASLTGNYTGTGGGHFLLNPNNLVIGAGGATFDFSAGMFLWNPQGQITATAGTLTNAGFLTVVTASTLGGAHLIGTIANAGTMTFQGDDALFGGTINNLAGATIDLQGFDNDSHSAPTLSSTVINAGTILRSTNTGLVSIAGLSNLATGKIDVETGTLAPWNGSGGVSTGGAFTVAAGATLKYNTGGNSPNTFTGTYTGSGSGHFVLDSNNLLVANGGARFDFPAGFFLWNPNGQITATAGTLTNTGFITVVTSSTLGGAHLTGTIANAGTMTFQGDDALFGGTLNNLAGATIDLQGFDNDGHSAPTLSSTVINSGTILRSTNTGLVSIAGLSNLATGKIVVETGTLAPWNGSGGVSTGGTFTVAAGATLKYNTGGNSFDTFTGNYTGSGGGHFVLNSDDFAVGTAGAVLDFPPEFFQWIGGPLDAIHGTLLNKGAITAGGIGLSIEGTVDNEGTIDIEGGNAIIVSGTVNNQSGGLIDFQGDGSLAAPGGIHFTLINNAGTIRKSAGAGTTSLSDEIDNTGTIEVDSGTINLAGIVDGTSGNTLSTGTWIATNGATLKFPSNLTITTNQADITLSGTGASFVGLASLAANAGSLTLSKGATLTTAGGLTNTGSLTLGAASTVSVHGNYSQGASATLEIGIGGRSSGTLFGKLTASGAAALAGAVRVLVENGFSPVSGDSYPILGFTSQTGGDGLTFSGINQGRFSFFQPVINATNIVLNTTASPADLVPELFNAPAGGSVGQTIVIPYQVDNTSSTTATGNWFDSFYLSSNQALDPSDVLISRVSRTGGVTGNGHYNGSLNAALPAVTPGNYWIIEIADSQGLVPDVNRANNTALDSASPILVSVPSVALGATVSGTISSGRDLLYQVNLPAGHNVQISLTTAAPGAASLYERYITPPSLSSFDQIAGVPTQSNQTITVHNTQAGAYYFLVAANGLAGTGTNYSLSVQDLVFGVTSVNPSGGTTAPSGVADQVTVTIHGSQFTPSTTASLVDAGGTSRPAVQTAFGDSSTLFATFDLGSVAAGAAQLLVHQGTQSIQTAFQVGNGSSGASFSPGHLSVTLAVPSVVRPPFRNTLVTITYTNDGGADLPSPILLVHADNGVLKLPSQSDFGSDSLELLAYNPSGPAGTLSPGASNTIQVDFKPATVVAHGKTGIIIEIEADNAALDWNLVKDQLRPLDEPSGAWDAIYANFMQRVGSTGNQFQALLDQNATYLSQFNTYTDDISQLLSFEFQMDDNFGAITQRYQSGLFGIGQTTLFDAIVSTDSSGNITILDQGLVLGFAKQTDGSFINVAGNGNTVTKDGSGAIQLHDPYGTVTAFRPDGRFDFTSDRNGNTLTAVYTSGKLSGLTDSAGDTVGIGLDGHGHIIQITAPNGLVSSYTYDIGGNHLLSVTTAGETTQYSYITGSTPQRNNALASVTNPAGVQETFSYDAQGRLIATSLNGGALPVTHSYSLGEITTTDALNEATTIWLNELGQIGRSRDALGNVTSFHHDSNGRLISMIGPDGSHVSIGHSASGDTAGVITPQGGQTHSSFNGPLDTMTQLIDALGNSTLFKQDQHGNQTSAIYADGSQYTAQYDTAGNVTSVTAAIGMATTYVYSEHNQLTSETFSDGSQITYTYDAHRNLASMNDSTGKTSYTYDAGNRLVTVTDPAGRTLSYTYNAAGQLNQLSEQSGYTVKYVYDSLGRLSEIDDASGNVLVEYKYDLLGRLKSTTMSNGTSTSYAYNANGDVTSLLNLGADASVLSSFAYTYDSQGRRSSMTTASGTTEYGYDFSGQLVSVTAPGGRTITYQYDASGNRVSVNDSTGGNTHYATNDLNEYTSAGATTFGYDANGNLISRSDTGGTTNYMYNAQGQLVGVLSPIGSWEYQYNGLGQLVGTTDNGQQVSYAIDPISGGIVGEYDATGNVIAHFVHGLGLAEQIQASGEVNAYAFDATGNTVALTDSTGAVVDQYSYLPSGESLAAQQTLANPFTFAGQLGVSSDGSGLSVMGARAYDPTLGRFIQRDPIGYFGGTSNLYQYALNDPVNMVDPSGTDPITDFTTAISVRLGFGTAGETVGPIIQRSLTNPANATYTSISTEEAIGTFGASSSIATETSGLMAPVSAGTIITLQAPIVVAGTGVAIALKDANTRLESTPTPAEIGPYVNNLERGMVNNSITLPANSPGDIIFPAGNNPQGNPVSITFQGGFNNPKLQQAEQNLLSDPDTSTFVILAVANGKTEQEAIQQALDRNPKAKQIFIQTVLSNDPNEITGPGGFGTGGFLTPGGPLPYRIDFENEPTANAPAQTVTVTEQLDPGFDAKTFELGDLGFGSTIIHVPSGLTSYSARIDATATLGVLVDVSAGLNLKTRLVTWTFTSLDPTTLDLAADPFAGFLPPDDSTGRGEGFVSYTVSPASASISNSTPIHAQSTIVFDVNAPIDTPKIVNTIDGAAPASAVNSLPATTTAPVFTVSWTGSDGQGSGIAGFTIFESDNGGAFQPFLVNTTQLSTSFAGQAGHTYRFFSVATDNLGFVQPTPSAAQATIQVMPLPVAPLVTVLSVQPLFNRKHQVTQILVTFSGPVNAIEAGSRAIYRLVTSNKRGAFTGKGTGSIALRSSSFLASKNQVILIPKKAFLVSKPVELIVNGAPPAGLQDTSGRFLKGGVNAVAVIRGKRISISKAVHALRVPVREKKFGTHDD